MWPARMLQNGWKSANNRQRLPGSSKIHRITKKIEKRAYDQLTYPGGCCTVILVVAVAVAAAVFITIVIIVYTHTCSCRYTSIHVECACSTAIAATAVERDGAAHRRDGPRRGNSVA